MATPPARKLRRVNLEATDNKSVSPGFVFRVEADNVDQSHDRSNGKGA
jgi:hypothetical protein